MRQCKPSCIMALIVACGVARGPEPSSAQAPDSMRTAERGVLEQAFSADGGRSWEPNWIAGFRRRASGT